MLSSRFPGFMVSSISLQVILGQVGKIVSYEETNQKIFDRQIVFWAKWKLQDIFQWEDQSKYLEPANCIFEECHWRGNAIATLQNNSFTAQFNFTPNHVLFPNIAWFGEAKTIDEEKKISPEPMQYLNFQAVPK